MAWYRCHKGTRFLIYLSIIFS